MGATDCIFHLKTTDKAELQKIWGEAVVEDRHQNGNSGYTGGPSSMSGTIDFRYFDNEPFADKHTADEFIMEKADKRDTLAVRFKARDGNIHTALGGLAAE